MMLAHGDRWGLRGLGAVLFMATLATACNGEKNMTDSESAGTSTGGTGTTGDLPTTSGTGTTGTPGTTTSPGTSTTDSPTTSGTTEVATSDTTMMFKQDGPMGECSPRLQDCGDGQKCTSYEGNMQAPPGWDSTKCVPEPMNAGAIGDECQLEPGEGPFSGLDNCAKGGICLNFDFETLTNGTCTEYCNEMDECPNTAGGKAICVEGANGGSLPICLATCDPIVQDCQNGQGCYGDPTLDGFICFTPDPGDETGTDNSPCEFTNACQPGFSCAAAAVVDGCDPGSIGCCTPFCEVSKGDAGCAAKEDCVPFYNMDPPPGLEDVGICAIPQ